MKRIMFGLVALLAMVIIVGCPPKVEKLGAPKIIGVDADSYSITVIWKVDPLIEGHDDFEGYNVYVYTDSAALMVEDGEDLNPHNTIVLSGPSYTATRLSDDSIYFVQVRTVNSDAKVGPYNTDVPLIKMSPRPKFSKTVYIEWDNSDTANVAIHFSTGDVKRRSAITPTWGDMWVDHECSGDTVFFQSAWKADTTAGYRDTKLANTGQFGFDEKWVATEPTLRVVNIKQGDLVFAKTVEKNYVKIHVDSVYLDTVGTSWVKITYGYQDLANLPNLIAR